MLWLSNFYGMLVDTFNLKSFHIQLSDVTGSVAIITAVTFDSRTISLTLEFSSINGRSATWLPTNVPQWHSFYVPFLE